MEHSNHHPEDELLTAYSAGSLPLSQALCISVHLEHCMSCGHKLQRLNHVGSELMQNLQPSKVSQELKNKVLDIVVSLPQRSPESDSNPDDCAVPRCLRQFVPRSYDDLPWKRVSVDIHSAELCRDSNGAKVELLKIRPGGSSMSHTHMGDEYTVILEGSFSDEAGLYAQGDFLLRDENIRHKPVATQDRECICLAVTEGPIQFTGLLNRLLNPLIRRHYA